MKQKSYKGVGGVVCGNPAGSKNKKTTCQRLAVGVY
jgi:hypothetical protein